jgi:hypothetical protein
MNDRHARRQIAEGLLGRIDWQENFGTCRCPGWTLHTTGGDDPDSRSHQCRVYIDRAPTIVCLHTSCGETVAAVNHAFRSQVGKAEKATGATGRPLRKSRKQIAAEAAAAAVRARRIALTQYGREQLVRVRMEYPWTVNQATADSPVQLPEVATHWRLLLSLFPPDDIIWIGDKYDSGAGKAGHFQPVQTWLQCQDPASFNFICPSSFTPGTESRSNRSVAERRFLVAESDDLTKDDTLAVIRWLGTFLCLRAVVDTGGKSVHGWFEAPNTATLDELRHILPAMKMDPALFKPSQPVRLPGSLRDNGRWQRLLWFGGAQ